MEENKLNTEQNPNQTLVYGNNNRFNFSKSKLLFYSIVGIAVLLLLITGISGFYFFNNSFKTPKKMDTSTWKTYNNPELNVSFAYPSNFSIENTSNDSQEIISFRSIDKWFVFNKVVASSNKPLDNQNSQTKTINGLKWKIIPSQNSLKYCKEKKCIKSFAVYLISINGYKYIFISYTEGLEETIEQILSTFKTTQK